MILTKSQMTIETILDAAQTLFLTKSYADVPMAEIAKAAGLTKGALYHHFASKEELYLALIQRDLREKRRLFEEAAGTDGGVRDRLRRLTAAFYAQSREKQRLIRLVRRDINTFDGKAREALVRSYQEALPHQVERILQDGLDSGELRSGDPRLLSWHFVAMVEVILSDYADSVLDGVDAKLNFVTDLFLDGAASPETRAQSTHGINTHQAGMESDNE